MSRHSRFTAAADDLQHLGRQLDLVDSDDELPEDERLAMLLTSVSELEEVVQRVREALS